MRNPYRALRALIPDPPLQVGDVIAVGPGGATLQMLDGGRLLARGEAEIGQRVFVRDGVIEGPAPVLPVEIIEL